MPLQRRHRSHRSHRSSSSESSPPQSPSSPQPPQPPRPRLPLRVKCLRWAIALFVLYTIVGFFVVPTVLKSQLLQQLPSLSKRQAAIQQVAFNPFSLSLSIRGIALSETDGKPFGGLDQFHARFELLRSIFSGAFVFHDITVTHPFIQITRNPDGVFNFANILNSNPSPPSSAHSSPAPLPSVIVDDFSVNAAEIIADDHVPKASFHTKISPINLKLTNFSSHPKSPNPYTFSATTEAAETVTASGNFTLQPLASSGTVNLASLNLPKSSPYAAAFTKARITDGRLGVGATYTLSIGADGVLALDLTNASVTLSQLRINSPDTDETVLSVPLLAVSSSEASLAKKSVRVASVQFTGVSILARQNAGGTINLLSLMVPPAPATPSPAPPPTNSTPWTAQVDHIKFDNCGLKFEDSKTATPAHLSADSLTGEIKGFTTSSNSPISANITVRLNEAGTLAIRGAANISPPSADLDVDLSQLDLRPFQPFLQGQVNLAIASGFLDVHGRAHYGAASNSPLASFKGGVLVTNLATTDLLHYKDFVKVGALTVSGADFSLQPGKLDIREVKLAGFNTTIIIDTNKQPNLLSIFPPKTAASNQPAAAASPQFPITLATFTLDNASFHFTDQSVEPNCLFDIQQLGGSLTNLSSHPQSPAGVDFQGNVDQFAPFSVTGNVSPLVGTNLSLDLSVTFKNTDLTAFTPYMEKYAGYPLKKGKLHLDLNYAIAQRKLTAQNKVVLANLTLGAKNDSTNATHLPVKLGVALLKDREGNIDLDIPLSGSLDDPQFRVFPLVMKVIVNLLAKAAVSPFSLLGKLVGGGDELSYVQFLPGHSDLSESEQAKVDKLINALYIRPALNLEIAGAADPVADTPGLAHVKLQEKVKALRAKELIADGTPPASVESIQMDLADYARLIKGLYTNMIDTKPAAALAGPAGKAPVTNAPVASAPPRPASVVVKARPEQKPGFFARFFGFFFRKTSSPAKPVKPDLIAANPAPVAAPKPATPASTPAPALRSPPAPDQPLGIEDMESRLASRIPVTSDDLVALMIARAHTVQTAILASGKIQGERLFLLAPKPLSTNVPGETRVNLSLE